MDTKEMFHIILEEIKISRNETNERLDKLESRMDSLDIRMDKLEARMDKLESSIDSLENRMDKLEHRVKGLEIEVKATKQLVQNFKWDIDLLANKQTHSEMTINRLERRIGS